MSAMSPERARLRRLATRKSMRKAAVTFGVSLPHTHNGSEGRALILSPGAVENADATWREWLDAKSKWETRNMFSRIKREATP